MKTITKKQILNKLEKVPDDYEIYVNYDVYINDPIEDCMIDHQKKRVTLI